MDVSRVSHCFKTCQYTFRASFCLFKHSLTLRESLYQVSNERGIIGLNLYTIFCFFLKKARKSAKKQQKSTFGFWTSKWSRITNFCPNYMIENAGESWDLVLQNGKKIFLIELSYHHLSKIWKLAGFLAKIA